MENENPTRDILRRPREFYLLAKLKNKKKNLSYEKQCSTWMEPWYWDRFAYACFQNDIDVKKVIKKFVRQYAIDALGPEESDE